MRRACATLGLAVAIALVLAGPSRANDSASELAAGGLALVRNDVVTMQREDLRLSPAEVSVRYEFRNDSGRPVTLRVAFPMPEVPAASPGGRTTTGGAANVMIDEPREPNFLGFTVRADGRAVTPEVEIRATLPDGREIAADLQAIGGLPLVLRSGLYFPPDDPPLDPAVRARLAALGAVEPLDDKGYRLPWTTRITFHWLQTFAPGVTVIEHRYRPVLGFRLIAVEESGKVVASGDGDPAEVFCLDEAARRRLRALSDAARARRLKDGQGDDRYLVAYTLGYVLRTGANWNGPIGRFRLEVASESVPLAIAGNDKPTIDLVALCAPVPLAATAPGVLAGEATAFVPRQDLRVLFVAE